MSEAVIDIAHELPASNKPVVVSDYPQYASFGMPQAKGQLWSLRSLWLDSVMHILTDTSGCQLNFVKYTYTKVESWFAALVFGTSGRDPFDEEADSAWELPLLNPVAYLNMFSTSLHAALDAMSTQCVPACSVASSPCSRSVRTWKSSLPSCCHYALHSMPAWRD